LVCDVTLKDDSKINWSRVMGHSQVTDIYLLALAVAHGGALATLDHRVALNAVQGAKAEHLQLL
jgi:predicted nucleic acid-binding protein